MNELMDLRVTMERVLAEHWWHARGMTVTSSDRCACGAFTDPADGDEDVSVLRARAFAAHQAEMVVAELRR